LEERFIFSIRRVRYVLTVFTDSDSALAMSPAVSPLASFRNTWNSRSDSCSCGAPPSLRLSCCASNSATAGEM